MYKEQSRHLMNNWSKSKRPFVFLIDFEMKNITVFPLDHPPNNLLFNFNGQSNYSIDKVKGPTPILKTEGPCFNQYTKAFDLVKKEILYGNTFLLNLTTKTAIESNQNLEGIFFHSQAKYKMLCKNSFVFFSPEPFIKIKDGLVSSFPMKGTIDALIPNAEQIILEDIKEKAEHNTIVDLIRNDLSIVAKNVEVPKFRYIDEIVSGDKRLLQVSSEIRGNIKEKYKDRLGDIIFSLLPAGSISGAPKRKTVEIIKKAENLDRGFYTGISGIFNGSDLDSCVMIRFVEQEGKQLFYRSGGGITHMSKLEPEYNEILQKIYVPTLRVN